MNSKKLEWETPIRVLISLGDAISTGPSISDTSNSVGRADHPHDLLEGVVRDIAHFFVCPVLDGVAYVGDGGFEAEGGGLRVGRFLEFG